ncbi:MAG: caspase family protein, partial [Thermoproteota archaeon]
MNKVALVKPAILITILASSLFLQAVSAPSEASEVEITPKVRVRGPRGRGGGKPTPGAATGVLGTKPPSPKDRWAVVIGISDYYGTANDIEYADDDALDVLEALIEVYGYDRKNVLLLVSDYKVNNATREDIVKAIDWLKENAGKNSEVFFFYSGHGARGKADDGDREAIDEAMVPYECSSASLIWDGELRTMFSNFETSRIVF